MKEQLEKLMKLAHDLNAKVETMAKENGVVLETREAKGDVIDKA